MKQFLHCSIFHAYSMHKTCIPCLSSLCNQRVPHNHYSGDGALPLPWVPLRDCLGERVWLAAGQVGRGVHSWGLVALKACGQLLPIFSQHQPSQAQTVCCCYYIAGKARQSSPLPLSHGFQHKEAGLGHKCLLHPGS